MGTAQVQRRRGLRGGVAFDLGNDDVQCFGDAVVVGAVGEHDALVAVYPLQQTATGFVRQLSGRRTAASGTDAENHRGQVRALRDLQLRNAGQRVVDVFGQVELLVQSLAEGIHPVQVQGKPGPQTTDLAGQLGPEQAGVRDAPRRLHVLEVVAAALVRGVQGGEVADDQGAGAEPARLFSVTFELPQLVKMWFRGP